MTIPTVPADAGMVGGYFPSFFFFILTEPNIMSSSHSLHRFTCEMHQLTGYKGVGSPLGKACPGSPRPPRPDNVINGSLATRLSTAVGLTP